MKILGSQETVQEISGGERDRQKRERGKTPDLTLDELTTLVKSIWILLSYKYLFRVPL